MRILRRVMLMMQAGGKKRVGQEIAKSQTHKKSKRQGKEVEGRSSIFDSRVRLSDQKSQTYLSSCEEGATLTMLTVNTTQLALWHFPEGQHGGPCLCSPLLVLHHNFSPARPGADGSGRESGIGRLQSGHKVLLFVFHLGNISTSQTVLKYHCCDCLFYLYRYNLSSIKKSR